MPKHRRRGIPERWVDYVSIGKPVHDTRFIAFKTPLKKELCDNLPQELRFTPEMLVSHLSEKDQRLGLLVDFTNTKRYYNSKYFSDQGIQYEKIFTEGHVVPNSKIVKRFFNIVDKFLETNDCSDLLIGAHCTHGVNRTGYFICKYMIEKLSVDSNNALSAFSDARGYPIERQNYIDDLHSRLKQLPNEDDVDKLDESNKTSLPDTAPCPHHTNHNDAHNQTNQLSFAKNIQNQVHIPGYQNREWPQSIRPNNTYMPFQGIHPSHASNSWEQWQPYNPRNFQHDMSFNHRTDGSSLRTHPYHEDAYIPYRYDHMYQAPYQEPYQGRYQSRHDRRMHQTPYQRP